MMGTVEEKALDLRGAIITALDLVFK